ncbi:MAG TPA: hypothetical protein ENI15_19605 [Spirochaetes bacterium]|nr:hypothetical protein [Spirochaetota bacterium]
MTARERFIKIATFERENDPSFFGIFAWNDAYRRWKKEGMPVNNFENMKEINMHFLGYQDQVFETIIPNAAVGGMGALMNPPWVPALYPLFEQKLLKDEGDTIVQVDYDGADPLRHAAQLHGSGKLLYCYYREYQACRGNDRMADLSVL